MFGRIGDTFALVAIGIYCLVIKVVITSLAMTNFAIVFAALGVLCFALAVDFAFNNPVLRRLARRTNK